MVQSSVQNAESLQDAFQVFNELSENLSRSYFDLEAQVGRLSEELAAARSERLKTLTEKAQLANRLQRLLEALPGGVLVTDGQGIIQEHNRAAAELLGCRLKGCHWRAALEQKAVPGADNPHQCQLRGGKTVSIAISSLGEEPGQIILLTDISDMRALQELVNQQKRLSMLGEMVASLAHQVRTPLSAALLYTSHLGRGDLAEAQRAKFAGKLAERLQHMERQVTDMLAFARVGRLTLEQTDLVALIERSIEAFEPNLAGRRITVRLDKGMQHQEILGNGDALQGIILNLLNNAVEAMGDAAGTVRILLEPGLPGWVRISVCDDGPGIPAQSLARVFEPFYTTRSAGTGLGLAIVDCVVRAHGGRVSCHSEPGQGASFVLELPAATERSLLPSGFSGTEQLPRPCIHGTA